MTLSESDPYFIGHMIHFNHDRAHSQITEEELDNSLFETSRPWEEQWESLKTDETDESEWVEQEPDDDDRQTRFWRHRPEGFAVNEKEHVIYVLEFETVSDICETDVCCRDPESSTRDLVPHCD